MVPSIGGRVSWSMGIQRQRPHGQLNHIAILKPVVVIVHGREATRGFPR